MRSTRLRRSVSQKRFWMSLFPSTTKSTDHEETHDTPNDRCEKEIGEGKGRLRPLFEEIDSDCVFSIHCQRKARKGATIILAGKRLKVGEFSRDTATVSFVPRRKIMIVKDKQKLCEYHL